MFILYDLLCEVPEAERAVHIFGLSTYLTESLGWRPARTAMSGLTGVPVRRSRPLER
ncbi:hypothetical protein PCAR4_830131 [Paraburkholderia caribensis]|nr:hypothetical protein PCAR4_830131 [Paraburkholderia caribensis]